MLQLHFSNRYEALTRLLLGNLGDGAGDVLEPVQIIVPSRAVEKSLTLAIADVTGICANVRFEFAGCGARSGASLRASATPRRSSRRP